MYDLVIVGGGPAGLSAAIQGSVRNKSVLLVSNEPTASPLGKAEVIKNYPGIPNLTGKELISRMLAQALALGAELRVGQALNVVSVGEIFYVGIGSDMVEAKGVILATGVAPTRKLPGESELLGRGVSYCATCDGMLYRGKRVIVAGNSPDWKKEAEFLREIGCQVTELPLTGLKILGNNQVEAVEQKGQRLECDGVFLLRSTVAPTDLLPQLEMISGQIKVNRRMETNIPGIYAAGDCTGQPLQIAKAVGEGQMAAHCAVMDRLEHSTI